MSVRWAAFLALGLLWGCYRAVEPSPPRFPSRSSPPQERVQPPRGAYAAFSRQQGVFTLGNGTAERKLWIHEQKKGVATASLRLKRPGGEFSAAVADACMLDIGGKKAVGYGGGLVYSSHAVSAGRDGSQQLRVTLRGAEPAIRLTLIYDAHPEAPLFGKRIALENLGSAPFELRSAETERLQTGSVGSARRWADGRRLSPARLPLDGGAGSGLVWLQTGGGWLGVVNGAPGPLKRTRVSAAGSVSAGVEAPVWVQPGQTIQLPPVYLWLGGGPGPEADNRRWAELFNASRRVHHVAAEEGLVSALESRHPTDAELSRAPVGSLVCVPYAWQEGRDEGREEWAALVRTAERARAAGLRFGIRTPLAWLPEGGSLLSQRPDWGAGAAVEWRGKRGVLARMDTDYADALSRTLEGIAQELELDGLILEGRLAPDPPADIVDPRWGAWNGLVEAVSRLKRSRPQMSVGVAGETYGMTDGFDAALYPWAFLCSSGGADDGLFWRRAYAEAY